MKMAITRSGVEPTELYVNCMTQGKLGDRPVAFILPGGPGADHTAYQKYTVLQTDIDLVFHDPRGCGLSDKGRATSYNMENYINDIDAIREQLSLEKIMVIGKSYGSMCALGYALRYPQHVSKLVLAAGAPSFHFLTKAKENVKRIGTPEQIQICEKLWAGEFQSKEELLRFFQLTNSLYSVKAREMSASINLNTKSNQFAYEVLNEGFRHQFWHFNYETKLRDVECPTLILAGKEDWINDPIYAEQMAAHIPCSQLHVFEQASHAMEADVPEQFFPAISRFIREV